MSDLDFSFEMIKSASGEIRPSIKIEGPKYAMLSNLSQGHLSRSEGVRQELNKIELVKGGKCEKHSFGGDDWCILDLGKSKTIIENAFNEFDPVEIETEQIYKLLTGWLEFLENHGK